MILTYPSNAELMAVQQLFLPTLTLNDLSFTLLPIVDHDAAYVEWEQRDNFTGLQQVRGIEAEPPSVPNIGWKRWKMEAGVYGEWDYVSEKAIIERRTPGTYNLPIPIDDLVVEKQDYLLSRRIDRLRWIIWTLLTSGSFSCTGVNGNVLHAGQWAIQTSTVSPLWSTAATSTPLSDLLGVLLLYRGISAQFGPNGMMIMNRKTANYLLLNTNANDLGRTRNQMGATLFNIDMVNEVLVSNGLPRLVVFEAGYYPDGGGAFTPFVPDGKVVIVGERPNGETLGEFQMTRNASNPSGAPGAYVYVSDSLDSGKPVPRKIRVDDGFNGGPALMFPSLIICLTVA